MAQISLVFISGLIREIGDVFMAAGNWQFLLFHASATVIEYRTKELEQP
jgi:hypothetical protein